MVDSFFPKDPKKIKARIRSYERKLKVDESDGYGKRYFLGPLYLLLGDFEGALSSYEWFDTKYPKDCGEPFQKLCWALTLFKAKKYEAATNKLRDTDFENPYIIPFLLGMNLEPLPIWHSSNWGEIPYVLEGTSELFSLWDKQALEWCNKFYKHPEIVKDREIFLKFARELSDLRPGIRRTYLVKKSVELERSKAPVIIFP